MRVELLKTMILAMVADEATDYQEVELINSYRNQYPPLKDVPAKTIKSEIERVIVLKQNGIDDSFMVEDIGKNLSKPERLTAFALASEVCASNFNISDDEINFLILLKQKWDIPKTVVESVFTSLNLRYGIPKTKDRI